MTGQPDSPRSIGGAGVRRAINIIGKAGSTGLGRDISLLKDVLVEGGHEVHVCDIDEAQAHRRRSLLSQAAVRWRHRIRRAPGALHACDFDVNLMLEHVWSQFLPAARRNVVIPNPEWFDRHDQRWLDSVDAVWTKTPEALRIFRERGCWTRHIGFTSRDNFQPAQSREVRFLHLAGKSPLKGSEAVLKLWAAHPEWPMMTVIQRSPGHCSPHITAVNIQRLCGHLDEMTVQREQNACWFHLCPSRTEGWGHYLVEAMSVGAVVFTVDAPPMNQLVKPERGVLISSAATGQQRLATTYDFSAEAMREAIDEVLSRGESLWRELSAHARDWYERNHAAFPARVLAALEEDCPPVNLQQDE